jgi:hypothetical protein
MTSTSPGFDQFAQRVGILAADGGVQPRPPASSVGSPAPWMRLWIRFVSGKNAGRSVSMTTHCTSTPRSRSRQIMVGSISATPPPCAVEFTIQTVRPRSARTALAPSSSSCRTAPARCATAA